VAALAGVSLEVREGELFTLLGPSGCGKTTILRCVAGFEQPTSGSIAFRGEELIGVPTYRVPRRGISYVPQGRHLFPLLTVKENLDIASVTRRTGAQNLLAAREGRRTGQASPAASSDGAIGRR
jgi:branched-chain amino acid transport system ATP-binding protein